MVPTAPGALLTTVPSFVVTIQLLAHASTDVDTVSVSTADQALRRCMASAVSNRKGFQFASLHHGISTLFNQAGGLA
jgi:hypothetical protein